MYELDGIHIIDMNAISISSYLPNLLNQFFFIETTV